MRKAIVIVVLCTVFAGPVYSESGDRIVIGLEPTVVFGIGDTTTSVAIGGALSGSVRVHDMLGVYGGASASLTQQASVDGTLRTTTLSLEVGPDVVPFAAANWFSIRGLVLNEAQTRSGTWSYNPGVAADLVVSPALTERLRFIFRGGLGYRFTGEPGLVPRFGAGLGLGF